MNTLFDHPMQDPSPSVIKSSDEHAFLKITTAIVSDDEGEQFVVSNIRSSVALRAASCLVVPHAGDMVLVAEAQDQVWILSVLVASGVRDLKLDSPHLHMSGHEATMHFNRIQASSQELHATHGLIHLISGKINATVAAMEWIGQRVSSLVDVMFSRHRQILREVSEMESVRCEHFDLEVQKVMSISTETGLITGQGLVKVDAAQVQIG